MTWGVQVGASWQWNLSGEHPNATVPAMVYAIDVASTGAAGVQAVKADHPNRKVICYVNIGSLELGSREDEPRFHPSDLGGPYPGWPDEVYVNIRSKNVRNIMKDRFKAMKDAGCDAIEPDNMALDYKGGDGFQPPLSDEDNISYMEWFSNQIHKLGMKVASKNGGRYYVKQPYLTELFDFAMVEECAARGNCQQYDMFIHAGKPVFATDYLDAGETGGCVKITGSVNDACATMNSHNFSGIIKTCDLTDEVIQCNHNLLSEYSILSKQDQECLASKFPRWGEFIPKQVTLSDVASLCKHIKGDEAQGVVKKCSANAASVAHFAIDYCTNLNIKNVPRPSSNSDAVAELVAIAKTTTLSTRTCWASIPTVSGDVKALCAEFFDGLKTNCVDRSLNITEGTTRVNLGLKATEAIRKVCKAAGFPE